MAIVILPDDRALDEVVWRHYGHLDDDLVAKILDRPFNRKLANLLILPQGTQVDMPDIETLSLPTGAETSFW